MSKRGLCCTAVCAEEAREDRIQISRALAWVQRMKLLITKTFNSSLFATEASSRLAWHVPQLVVIRYGKATGANDKHRETKIV